MTDNLPVVTHNELVNTQVQDDLIDARNNIREVIEQTKDAVVKVADYADTSQAARYYEVLAALLKTSLEANRDLVDIHRKKKDLVTSSGPPTKTVNNLIMTSSDMLKLIRGEEKND